MSNAAIIRHFLVVCSITFTILTCNKMSGSGSKDFGDTPPQFKNELEIKNDTRMFADNRSIKWIKFSMPLNQTGKIYFQDSTTFALHFDFYRQVLRGLIGAQELSKIEFIDSTTRTANRKLLLGTVMTNPEIDKEFAIQLVSDDPIPKEQVAQYYLAVKAVVKWDSTTDARSVYIPPTGQEAATLADAAFFADKGIEIVTLDRWLSKDLVLNPSWNVGKFVLATALNLKDLVKTGMVNSDSILVLDRVPAEVPFVRGIISFTPVTPNSHAVVLAQSIGIPFAVAHSKDLQEEITKLNGRRGAFGAETSGGDWIRVADLESLPADDFAALQKLRQTAAVKIPPFEVAADYVVSVDNLTPDAIKFYGGKSSNFGFLRREIEKNSPRALAISFRLWSEFLAQSMPSGKTLRQTIDEKLAPFKTFPVTNPAGLVAALDDVRKDIKKKAKLTDAQKQALMDALKPFHDSGMNKLRFRSSTNVEDTGNINGAGLYDSYSGCYLDDLSKNTSLISKCTSPLADGPAPGEPKSMFDAIQKTFASFYNDNAYIERLRMGITEENVGMAITVHESTPDEIEKANGVMTIHFRNRSVKAKMVTNKGAASVTNPPEGIFPEEVEIYSFGRFDSVERIRNATGPGIVIGESMLGDDKVYAKYYKLALKAGRALQAFYKNPQELILDFEYKLMTDNSRFEDGIQIKQIRTIPVHKDPDPKTLPIIVERPTSEQPLCSDFVTFNQPDYVSQMRNVSTAQIEYGTWPILLQSSAMLQKWVRRLTLNYDDLGTPKTIDQQLGALVELPVSPQDELSGQVFKFGFPFKLPGSNGGDAAIIVKVHRNSDSLPILGYLTTSLEIVRTKSQAFSVGAGEDSTGEKPLQEAVRTESVDYLTSCKKLLTLENPRPTEGIFEWQPSSSGPSVSFKHIIMSQDGMRLGGSTSRVYTMGEGVISGITTQPIAIKNPFAVVFSIKTHNHITSLAVNPWKDELTDQQKAELKQKQIYMLVFDDQKIKVGVVKFDGTIATL